MEKSLDALGNLTPSPRTQTGEIVAGSIPTTSMEEACGRPVHPGERPGRLEIKRSILAQVEHCAASDALYASSTSGLLISEIVAEAAHPERCVGAHP